MFETEDQLMAVFDTAIADSGLWLGLPGRRTFLMDEVEGIHGRVDRMMVSLPSSLRPTKTRSQLLQQETCCRIIVALRTTAQSPRTIGSRHRSFSRDDSVLAFANDRRRLGAGYFNRQLYSWTEVGPPRLRDLVLRG